MNGCTVNIADFRCRESKPHAAARSMLRMTHPSAGLSLVETRNELRPRVYDISEARESHRMGSRIVFRPLGVSRHAKVIRFRTNEPIQMNVRLMEKPREKWRGATEGSFDLPPAA